MEISVLTYNVLFNQAINHLNTLLKSEKPDILCFQEIDTSEDNLSKMEVKPYRLADYSNSFVKHGKIYGVATFYNTNTLRHIDTEVLRLPKSMYEVIVTIARFLRGGNKARTVLLTDFIHLTSGKQIKTYNTHLSNYGSNSIRYKQISSFLKDINPTTKQPLIICGDFNYLPYQRKKLEAIILKYGLLEATKDLPYTFTYHFEGPEVPRLKRFLGNLFLWIVPTRVKIDYIFYSYLTHIHTKRIDSDYSDHYPVISTFSLSSI